MLPSANHRHLRPLFLLLLGTLLSCGSIAVRANGWEHLAVPFPALVKGLKFGEVETRRRAAHSLGARKEGRGVSPLMAALARKEPDRAVRAEIHVALGQIGDPATVPVATGCLSEEPEHVVRASCAIALGLHGSPAALAALTKTLERDNESELVRARVIEGLGRFEDAGAVAALSKALTGASTTLAKRRTVRALGNTRHASAAPVLLDALDTAGDRVDRLLATRALALVGSAEATPVLVAALDGETDPEIRAAMVMAIGTGADESTYDVLIARLADPSLRVRRFAVQGLTELGRPDAAPAIARLADELVSWLDGSSPASLAGGPDDTLDRLAVLQTAFRAAIELGAAPATDALLIAAVPRPLPAGSTALGIKEGIYETRRLALYGLGYTGSPRALKLVGGAAGIGDADPRLRATAVRSIGVLSLPGSAARVLPLLDDSSAEVRWTAAMVLGRLPDQPNGGALSEALGDPNSEVRRQAALSLGYLGWTEGSSSLEALAKGDSSKRVREAAAFAASLLKQ